jgi:diadenosine tetraphosphate (Ap4A) HIT family hydrolase
MNESDCPLCAGAAVDAELMRIEVWSNDLWRLTTAQVAEVAGFSYLEPRRHITDITQLSGEEAATFGEVIASASTAIKDATGADLIYAYIFGDSVAHLHVHLAPHRHSGSPLSNQMVKGARHQVTIASGAEVWASDRYSLQPVEIMEAAINDIRASLNQGARPSPQPDA